MNGLLVAALALPLVMLLLLGLPAARQAVVRTLGLAPVPAVLLLPAAFNDELRPAVVLGPWTFTLDQPGAMMLTASAILWCIGGHAASKWLKVRPGQAGFAMWWLLTMAGSLGVFAAADLVSFYLLYAAASLPAYGLIVFGGGPTELRAGKINLAAALLGEGLILAAFVILAANARGPDLLIGDLVSAAGASPHRDLVMVLAVLGFGFKIGLVPLHGWMPLSYASGPLTAAAVLSGATSKAGIIGLIRFLPFDTPLPLWGNLLLVAGLVSAFYGAIAGLTQRDPRSVLAYSSVSQLGQMTAVLGLGLAAGNAGAGRMVAFYAVYHILVKGGLFLALGAMAEQRPGPARRWGLLLAAALSLGFAGLPMTGGALGKLAFKPIIGSEVTAMLFAMAAVGSTLLMLQFVQLLRRETAEPEFKQRGELVGAWLALAIAALLLPWWFFSAATELPVSYAVHAGVILELALPVVTGTLFAIGMAWSGLRVPQLPAGGVFNPMVASVERGLSRGARMIARLEAAARDWTVSTVLLALVTVLLTVALVPR